MKKTMSILVILLIALNLVACGNQNDKEVEVKAKSEDKAVAEAGKEEVETEPETETEPEASESKVTLEDKSNDPDIIIDETETTLTYKDGLGDEVVITKNPSKVVVLYNSLLGLWYFMEGTSLTKVAGDTNVPEEAMGLVDLGSSSSVSLEAVVALEPDLVVMASNVSATVEMAPLLKEMGIETLIVESKMHPFQRFVENAYLFGKINGTDATYEDKIMPILDKIQEVIDTTKTAKEQPKVAAIFATSKSLTVETDASQVGEIVSMLGASNIYSEDDLQAEGETRIPFSIEAIITQNPQVILISTMGTQEDAKATVDKMIEENPAWNEVDAVKNEQVFYLPKDLSVYKPNERYGEAFELIAQKIYPELFE